MELLEAYLPIDRRLAILAGTTLPDHSYGAALFADISGFTPLTEALVKALGPRRGVDELTRQLNRVYEALIGEVHRYRGSVLTFSGDAITCWFDAAETSIPTANLRAMACGLAMQQAMQPFAAIPTPGGDTVSLSVKVAITAGPVRRFLVGDPQIQRLDVLAGATMARMAQLEKWANKGEVVVGAEALTALKSWGQVKEWRGQGPDKVKRKSLARRQQAGEAAVVAHLTHPVDSTPWPAQPPQNSEIQEDNLWRPWLLPPIYERLQSGQEQFLAEIRPAVALFLQFGGIDYDHDDAAGAKLNTYIGWVQQVLARYGSYLLQLTIGDKGAYFYAAFGAPLAYEDDADRAIAAALELRAPPPQLTFITSLKIGLSYGQMRAGAYGSSTRRTYGVLGDEVNIAARLMERAEAGQILLSQPLAQTVAQRYYLEPLEPLKLKGKQAILPVSRVLGRRSSSLHRPGLLFSHPLVGRADEMARLGQLLTLVAGGQGQVIRLAGPPGVGKSRLAAELMEQAIQAGFQVALGLSQSAYRDTLYYAWRHIVRSLLDLPDEPAAGEDPAAWQLWQMTQIEEILTDLNPDWLVRLPLLGDLLDLPLPDNPTTAAFDPQLRQEALVALVVEIVQTWAGGRPSLLLLEDAHWLDEASQRLTLALARVIAPTPLLLGLVHRLPTAEEPPILPDLSWLAHYRQLNLGELPPESVARLAANRLQGQVSPLALALIQTQAQGNPFFAEEVIETMQEVGTLTRQTDGRWGLTESALNTLQAAHCLVKEPVSQEWTLAPQRPLPTLALGLPDTIQGLVLARLDRLPEAHKVTLKVASVIGTSFEFETLARAHPLQPERAALLAQVRALEARDFTRLETPPPRLTYRFKHNITREVVYGTLLQEQQHNLHRAVGETLEALQPEGVEPLAYHFSRSGVRAKTLHYLDLAGRKAQREYANETALNYYRQALALEERWAWRQGEIEVLHLLGQRAAERASLELLAASLSRGEPKKREAKRRGGAAKRAEQPGEPSAMQTAVPADLHPSSLILHPSGALAYLWGQYYEAIGEYAQAQTAIERAVTLCLTAGDGVGEMRCLAQLGLIARRQGDYALAKAWYQQALAVSQGKTSEPNEITRSLVLVLNGLGIVYRQQGEFDQARLCHEQALALSRQAGNRRREADALNNLGVMAFYQRHFEQALLFHQQALEIRQTIGDRAGEGVSLMNLAQTVRDAGDYSQAEGYLSKAMAIQQFTGNRWEELNIWNDLGGLYYELGDYTTAQNCLERGLQLSQEINDEAGQAFVLCNLGLVMLAQNEEGKAEKLLTEGLTLAQTQLDRDLISTFFSYLSLVSLQADQLPQSIAWAKAALSMRQELGLYLRTADDLATLAMAYLQADQPVEALPHAQQTLTILAQCGGVGPEFPQRAYFICYQVLSAAGQIETARAVLESAYNLVLTRAEKITDPLLRHSFLERVAVNREIVAEYGNLNRDS